MGKRLLQTPNSKIRSALRQLFLRSRERAAVLKEAGYCCSRCGAKQSRAKGREVYVEVHHKAGILNWDRLILAVREYLLDKEAMVVYCRDCHKEEHSE